MSTGACSECGRVLSVTAEGVVRVHGYSRGGGDTEIRCPGSAKPPSSETTMVTCPWCLGGDGKDACQHCKGSGEISMKEMGDLDAVLVVQKALEASGVTQAVPRLAETSVRALMAYGFFSEPEEAPDPTGTGKQPEKPEMTGMEKTLARELMQFYQDWKDFSRGPQKPELVERSQKIEALLGGGS
jgi:hypothetical protein